MKLTKGQKTTAGVLAVCLLALGVDQAFLGPQQSNASAVIADLNTPTASNDQLATDDTESIEPADLMIPESVAASNLQVIEMVMFLDPENIKDAFRKPQTWMLSTPDETKTYIQRMNPEEFKKQYNLDATMVADSGSYAIVDGKLLRIGEVIDGWRLISVAERSAIFESHDVEVELDLGPPIEEDMPDNRRKSCR